MKQTLLLGNGLNLLIDKDKWEWKNLLTSCLKDNCKLVGEGKLPIPYTHLYEDIYLNSKAGTRYTELEVKKGIADKLNGLSGSRDEHFIEIMHNLLSLDFNDILTTNYDYSIENFLINEGYVQQVSENVKERIYSIRRNDVFMNGNAEKRIWHIHGEAKNPITVMLGYDHYCGSIARVSEYLKRGKSGNEKPEDFLKETNRHYIVRRIKYSQNAHDLEYKTWLDVMFLSDVHILGLGLGFSEIDLWWVLNKRYRYIKETLGQSPNTIYYYGHAVPEIREMLEVYGVNVDNATDKKPSDDGWISLYESMVGKIKVNVNNRTE